MLNLKGLSCRCRRSGRHLHHPNFLAALAALDDPALVLKDYMQPDAIHPNAAGVTLIVQDIGPSVLKLIK